MEQASVTRSVVERSRQRSRQEIYAAIEEFEKAGNISPKEFAEMYQISEATFYNWQKRYKFKDVGREEPKGFSAISIAPDRAGDHQEGVFAEVKGKVIRFYQRVEPSYLKELLS